MPLISPTRFYQPHAGLFVGGGGGGGGASIAGLFGESIAGSGGDWTTANMSFSTGLAVVGVMRATSAGDPTGVQINTVNATQIGTAVGDTGQMTLWRAAVSSGTGNVVVQRTGGFASNMCACGWMITGNGSNTPTATVNQDNFTVNHADPQGPLGSFTVNSGGVGLIFLGGDFNAAAGRFPVVWTAATRDSITETQSLAGNTASCAGAHVGPGTYTTIDASGTSSPWQYSGFMAAAFA